MMNEHEEKTICLACYGKRLAAIIDSASDLLVFKLKDDKIYPAGHLSLPLGDLPGMVSLLKSCGVDILICGGISGCTIRILQNVGILVIPWIAGTIEQVLSALQNNRLDKLTMPGCRSVAGAGCHFRRRQQRQGKGGGRNENSYNCSKQ
ncbi:NifB/NifX family molybdenum-iron cluster-binding protein [Desulfohalobiaceae bacterium Ax17]|uniref:NifB/NifX family molybdenum-iron cluster-binding protein n=1 Tax=Desulfovulcanus ferrireducens TaxID=2831190 RepID=UPI00207BCC35|nr:NifB/NifX family molybdenum-iron cluster-binding protein [Desulfovulcanus ferrireducens]MBT8762375.1 NifB/NifX family molybdenum-iron cluster-binding protein [Desulfovulcanus ferrireducens]